MTGKNILSVENLKTYFSTRAGLVKAVDGVSFSVSEGEALGLAGESGCGKSVTVLSILRLVLPPGRIEGGCILYGTKDACIDLVQKNDEFMRSVRGNDISMIFQEAGNALNPVLSVGDQVSESFLLHRQQELCESVMNRLKGEHKQFLVWRYRHKLRRAAGNGLKDRRYGRLIKKEALRWSVDLLRSLGIPNPDEVVRYAHRI